MRGPAGRVLGVPDRGGFIVIGANFGQRADPGWCYNLRADPRVMVDIGGVATRFRALELRDPDRVVAFARATTLNPGWTRFQERAGQRVIPVFRLAPAATSDPTGDPWTP